MADDADPAGELTLLLDDDVVDIEDYAAEARRRRHSRAGHRTLRQATDVGGASRDAVRVGGRSCTGGSGGMVGISCPPVGASTQAQRSQFLQVATQGALNLTTIDWQQAERDVQRILDGATGQFHDDIAMRSQPFVDVVKEAKSTSVGTITEAGLESERADSAQVLVAVTVKTSNVDAPNRIHTHGGCASRAERVGDQAKVSNVEFVS